MKNTLVLGATTNKMRYAYRACEKLVSHNHPIIPVGIKKGIVFDRSIINTKEIQSDVDTITLYIGPRHQAEWSEYILNTKPNRVIFNPGTENEVLQQKLQEAGIFYDCLLYTSPSPRDS